MKTYTGRLACDGEGNLLASEATKVGERTVGVFDADGTPILDENGTPIQVTVPIMKFGKNHGLPVAHDPEHGYVFVEDGEPSHNERHHQQFAVVVGSQTADPNAPGYAGTQANPTEGNEHHWEVLPDDAHYDASAPGFTRAKLHSDRVSSKLTSHTEAYTS